MGEWALPLAWRAETGAANIGFAGQQAVLEQVLAWLPPGVRVRLLADRFDPSAALLGWLQAQGWGGATTFDYATRWAIEPMFSDLKGRGFYLERSQLAHADR